MARGWTARIAGEAAAWKELRAQLIRYAGILKPLLTRRPPDLDGMALSESAGFGLVALTLRRLGKEDMRDFLRMLLMNVADVLDEHLRTTGCAGCSPSTRRSAAISGRARRPRCSASTTA